MERRGGRRVDPPAARPAAGGMIEAGDGAESRAPRPMTEGRRNPAGRQEGSDSKTAGGSVETQTDVTAAHGDVPPRFAPWLGPVSPPICPGALLVGSLSQRLRLSAISRGGGIR